MIVIVIETGTETHKVPFTPCILQNNENGLPLLIHNKEQSLRTPNEQREERERSGERREETPSLLKSEGRP